MVRGHSLIPRSSQQVERTRFRSGALGLPVDVGTDQRVSDAKGVDILLIEQRMGFLSGVQLQRRLLHVRFNLSTYMLRVQRRASLPLRA